MKHQLLSASISMWHHYQSLSISSIHIIHDHTWLMHVCKLAKKMVKRNRPDILGMTSIVRLRIWWPVIDHCYTKFLSLFIYHDNEFYYSYHWPIIDIAISCHITTNLMISDDDINDISFISPYHCETKFLMSTFAPTELRPGGRPLQADGRLALPAGLPLVDVTPCMGVHAMSLMVKHTSCALLLLYG